MLVALIGLGSTTFASNDRVITREDVLDVAKEFHPPGCTTSMTADYCQMATAGPFRNEIYEMLKKGMDKGEVMDALVNKYSTKILAAPEKKGFQWVAWILPFVAVFLGAIFILFLIKKVLRKPKQDISLSTKPKFVVNEEQLHSIEKEMKNLL